MVAMQQSEAQNNRREFIESSSPLPNGDRVISRSEPGREIQTVIVVTGESVAGPTGGASQNRLDLTSYSNRSTRGGPIQATAANSPAVERYPYPAAQRSAYYVYPQSAYQQPTLGIGRARMTGRTALGSNCNCNTPQTPVSNRVIVPTSQFQPAAAQNLTIQDPITNGVAMSSGSNTTVTMPQSSTIYNGSRRNPVISGSGVYQPMVRLANVPPGSYLGQGIIGQPTAYVDGQPIRNLIRYVFP